MTADKDSAGNSEVQVYNLDPAKTPGGMKVRWRVRIATGKEAERLEKQQNQVIIKLLAWADQYLRDHETTGPTSQETGENASFEITGNAAVMSPGRSRIRNETPPTRKGHAA